MIQVMDLAFQGIEVRAGDGLKVRELMDGQLIQPEQCVHDVASQLSLMVNPGHVTSLVETFALDPGSRLADSPVLSHLMYGQMTAHRDMPASAVLSLAEWHNQGYIIVESDAHFPVGIIGVAHLRNALEHAHAVLDAGLGNAVSAALRRGGLSAAIYVLDNHFRPGEFHSESINETPHPALRCEGGGGRGHYVPSCPCANHRGVGCR